MCRNDMFTSVGSGCESYIQGIELDKDGFLYCHKLGLLGLYKEDFEGLKNFEVLIL